MVNDYANEQKAAIESSVESSFLFRYPQLEFVVKKDHFLLQNDTVKLRGSPKALPTY
jgi:hypothetical protein